MNGFTRRLTAAAIAIVTAGAVTAAPAVAAPTRCAPKRGTTSIAEPWGQRRLNLPQAWRLSRGAKVTVAIVDSGVDVTHPQLTRVTAFDLTETGKADCVGHGTAVAGIIGGARLKGVPFAGVAPEARLISIKQPLGDEGDLGRLALGIVKAAQLGADVINVSIQASDQPDLRNAVAYALAKDAVVVAAAGNVNKEDGTPAPAYPAAYPGVISVGAANSDGSVADYSNSMTPVTVLAPGSDITSTWPGRSYVEKENGTSFAAAYVSGVAALVRSRYPELNKDQVRWRIARTADGASGTGSGAGMVNPLLAVSTIMASDEVALAPQEPTPLPADAIRRTPPEDALSVSITLWVALLCLAGVLLAVVFRFAVPRGRRRGWRPGHPGEQT
ncbi:type VII secretion-associated serine protease mycosin [Streptosporangium sp. NPDC020145]|uniref:type VII secretion-associated serine protease mycosin n=1 Tax=Streptosporangium sp. NPDC020145 TaxID=3154694 RepID=UPI00341A5B53